MTECVRMRELLGGYVLEALEPDEGHAVGRHLEVCPRCRHEQAQLASVPALLDVLDTSDAVPKAPPPELEETILDRFARERGWVAPIRIPRRRPWAVRLGVAGTLAAVAGTLALAGVFSPPGGGSAFAHVRLRGVGGAAADADLRALRAGTGVRLSVDGLPASGSRVYQLWCVAENGDWISGGTFRVDERGRARVSLTSAARPGEYEIMLVTRRDDRARGRRVLAGKVDY